MTSRLVSKILLRRLFDTPSLILFFLVLSYGINGNASLTVWQNVLGLLRRLLLEAKQYDWNKTWEGVWSSVGEIFFSSSCFFIPLHNLASACVPYRNVNKLIFLPSSCVCVCVVLMFWIPLCNLDLALASRDVNISNLGYIHFGGLLVAHV